MSPQCEVAAYRFQDLNNDKINELFVVGKQGEIRTWSRQDNNKVSFAEVGSLWSLPYPQKSLLSLSSFLAEDKTSYLMALAPDGLWAYAIHENAGIEQTGIRINRRMKFRFRLDQPAFSNFLQDINQDGKLDVLVPLVNYCEIWINGGLAPDEPTPANREIPLFHKMGKFPVKMTHHRRTDLSDTTGRLSEHFSIPSLLMKDINGDEHLDLVVTHESKYDYYLLDKEGLIPDKPTASLDLALFQDTTPKVEGFRFGETLSAGSEPQLTESDLNSDDIPDYVIWHRRKLWFFHGTKQGPQFTNPSSIIKIAEDITLFWPCPLDEDDYPDLLMMRFQIPSISKLLQGFFMDWDIKFESMGYQSKQGQSFEDSPKWEGNIFLRLPSILSLASNPDLSKKFKLDQKYGPALKGDFNGDAALDLAMSNTENGRLEIWFGKEGDQDIANLNKSNPKEFAATIRRLLFTKTDNVWDIDRIITFVHSLMDKQILTATGGKDPDLHLAQFKDKKNLSVVSVDFNHDDRHELLFVYSDPQAGNLKKFELYGISRD